MELIGEGRALHVCDVCGHVDDHSRHSFAGMTMGGNVNQWDAPTVELVRQVTEDCRTLGLETVIADGLLNDLLDRSIQDRHRDCCRTAGCPTGECARIEALGGGDLRGAELVQFLMDNADLLREEFMRTSEA